MSGEGHSRRELFRLFARPLAEAADRALPPRAPPPVPPAPPPVEVPAEEGRLVVDLSRHPVVPGTGIRVVGPGAAAPILLARVSLDHYAAVSGDCPECGGALSFDGPSDAVHCPRGVASFRLDGCAIRGPAHLRLRPFLVARLGDRVEIDPAGF